jgi:hypothetical protein
LRREKKPDDTQPSGFQFSSAENRSELHDDIRLEHQILAIPRDRELLI